MYNEQAQNGPAFTKNLEDKVPKLLAIPTSTPDATWRRMLQLLGAITYNARDPFESPIRHITLLRCSSKSIHGTWDNIIINYLLCQLSLYTPSASIHCKRRVEDVRSVLEWWHSITSALASFLYTHTAPNQPSFIEKHHSYTATNKSDPKLSAAQNLQQSLISGDTKIFVAPFLGTHLSYQTLRSSIPYSLTVFVRRRNRLSLTTLDYQHPEHSGIAVRKVNPPQCDCSYTINEVTQQQTVRFDLQ